MVNIELINNAFNDVLGVSEKCGRATYSKERGSKVSVDEIGYNDDLDMEVRILKYDNGVEVHMDDEYNIVSFTNEDGLTMDYMFDRDYSFFESQKEEILKKFGTEDLYFFNSFIDKFASWRGFALNRYLRGLISKEQLKNEISGSDYNFLVEQHDRFLKILDGLTLPEGDFYSVRVADHLHDNDSVDKGITWDKGHTSTTTGAVMDDLSIFADTLSSSNSCWRIITDYSGQSNVKGAFFGNALLSERATDWEHEVHHAPMQKFERVLIDEENKIIVQRPYDG